MTTRRDFILQSTALAAATPSTILVANSIAAAKENRITHYTIPNTELSVSRLAHGLLMWNVGWNNPNYVSETAKAAQAAYEYGIDFFDTADIYAGGLSEVALGQFLQTSSGLRNKVVVQTKCGLYYDGRRVPGQPLKWDGSDGDMGPAPDAAYILRAVEGSLQRLKTDWIDILILHAPHPLSKPEEIAQAVDQLITSGKVRYFGVSNHNAGQIELLKKNLRQPVICSQIWLSLAYYAALIDTSGFGSHVDYCRANKISVQAYSPLKGEGVFNPPSLWAPGETASEESKRVAKILNEISTNYNVTPAAIMLAWLFRHPAAIIPIIGASKRNHIAESCAADKVCLTPQEWSILLEACRLARAAASSRR